MPFLTPRNTIRQREDDADQRDPVGNAVVDPQHERLSAERRIDHQQLPQRPPVIERPGHEIGDEALQPGLAQPASARHPTQVVVEIEIGIIPPAIARPVGHDALGEAPVNEHAFLDGKPQTCEIEIAVKQHDPDNLHQIGRAIHAQPGGIDTGYALA